MAENKEILNIEPGSYNLHEVLLTNSGGETIDILNLISELKVVESVFQLFASYSFTIVDSVALLEKYQITGNEKIKLTLLKKNSVDGNEELVVRHLVMSGISQYAKIKNEQQVYVLNCISETAMIASVKRLSRSVRGNLVSICNDIYKEIEYKQPLNILDSSSQGNYKIILPNYTAAETLKRLVSKAQTNNGNVFFLFETLWHKQILTSYEEITRRSVYDTYAESSSEEGIKGTVKNYNHNKHKIMNIASKLGANHYESFRNGSFVSKTYDINMTKKTIQTSYFDVNDRNGNTPSMERDYMLNESYKIGDLSYKDYKDAQHFIIAYNSELFNPNEDGLNEKNNTSLAKRRSVITNHNAMTHTITVSGDTNLRAGEVIFLRLLPSIMTDVSGNNHQDDLLSGKYYIATTTHSFGLRGSYSMKLNIKRDTYTNSLLSNKYDGLDA